MDRIRAYALLAAELERWRLQPRQQVAARVGGPAVSVLEMVGNEPVCIKVKVRWADDRRTHLRVEAVAYGPSNWKLKRLEEAITLEPVEATR
jgi:hypothetical protein